MEARRNTQRSATAKFNIAMIPTAITFAASSGIPSQSRISIVKTVFDASEIEPVAAWNRIRRESRPARCALRQVQASCHTKLCSNAVSTAIIAAMAGNAAVRVSSHNTIS